MLGYSDAPTTDQQALEPEPPFFRAERQLLQCTELYVPNDTDLRFSDTQLALYLLSTAYGLSLSALAAIPAINKETNNESSNELPSNDELITSAANHPGSQLVVNRFESFGHGWGYSVCLLYTSPSPRDGLLSRMPSSA